MAINLLRCPCSTNGPHNATYNSRHSMEVVDSTCVLDLQVLLHERLKDMCDFTKLLRANFVI